MNTHNHDVFQIRTKRQNGAVPRPATPLGLPGRVLSSDAILRGQREIGIEHEGALYRLKLTRLGKLILNK